MKKFVISFLIIILFKNPLSYSQTVSLGGIEFSIGDSLNEVISKIDTNYYKFELLEEEKMKQLGLLFEKNKINSGSSLIGVLTFLVLPAFYFEPPSQPVVISIRKYWADWTSNIIDVMKKFYDILEKYGVDKYDNNISFEKDIDPDGNYYNIYIKTNHWHEIEFFFHQDSFQ